MTYWLRLLAFAVAFWAAVALTVDCSPIDSDCALTVGVAAARSAEFY